MRPITCLPILFICFAFTFSSCQQSQRPTDSTEQENTEVRSELNNDIFKVPYTYWWDKAGPFIGLCGSKYSFVFLGEVKSLGNIIQDSASLYTSQKGQITIETILHTQKQEKKSYEGQGIFESDCFFGSDFRIGDLVMVFCYEYEGEVSIPGKRSIVKLKSKNDPLIESIKTYIAGDQQAILLKNDMALWEAAGYGDDLGQIIDCAEMTMEEKN
ncbi:MAG: hypothetical protein AAFY71_09440 [Bacteroidota bacterium]